MCARPSINTPAGNLSGGNQQKVIVARELSRDVKLAIAAQPHPWFGCRLHRIYSLSACKEAR